MEVEFVSERTVKRPGWGRILLGTLIAAVAAILTPLWAGVGVAVFVFPLATVLLYFFSGKYVAGLSAAFFSWAFAVCFGNTAAIVYLLAFGVPSLCYLRCLRRNVPCLPQIFLNVCMQILWLLIALVVARLLTGRELMLALTDEMKKMASLLSPGVVDTFLARLYQLELPEKLTAAVLQEGFLAEDVRAMWSEKLWTDLYPLLTRFAPGALLSAGIRTAVFCTAIPVWILHRKDTGEEDRVWIPLGKWFLPWQITAGMIVVFASGLILKWIGMKGSSAVLVTAEAVISVICRIMAVASLERRMSAAGWKTWLRIMLLCFAALIGGMWLTLYGTVSVMFGSFGAVNQIMMERKSRQ